MQLSILFLLFLIFILKNVGSSSCPESLTTVDQVDGCPRNKEEWEYNAMKKNCSSVSQNCVNSSEFLYHCVINEFVNMTIEVCAPKVTILGRNCAEFNMHGAVIQDTVQGVNATCKDQNPPCPFRYNSTDSYKYQRCYSYIKREDQTIPCNKTVTVKNIRSDKKAWLTVSVVFITFTVCLMCVLGALLIQRYRKRLSNRNEDDEEAMPLIQPTVSITKRENLNWVSSIYIGDKYCCMAYLNPHSPEDIVSVGKVERIGVLITDLVSGEIVEFGDDAREIYIENRDGYQDYIFLDELNVKKENVSEQHPLKTSQIYKQLINYLIRKIWKEMSDANPKEESLCKSCDVNYVITVPYHWKDEIKMLRKAFEEVMVDFHHTIQKDKLHIKLREVAISPYIHEVNDPVTCLNLNVDNMTLRKNKTYVNLHVGSKYCNLIFLRTMDSKRPDKISSTPCIEKWETTPETKFVTLFENLFTTSVFTKWRDTCHREYIFLLHLFEKQKYKLHEDIDEKEVCEVNFSSSLIDLFKAEGYNMTDLEDSARKIGMELKDNGHTFILSWSLLKTCFSDVLNKTHDIIRQQEQKFKDEKVRFVLMTGSYSQMKLFQHDAEKKWFQGLNVTVAIPVHAGSTFAMGAAYFFKKFPDWTSYDLFNA